MSENLPAVRSAFQAVRDAARLARLATPAMVPPEDVTVLAVSDDGYPVLQWDEPAARWIGGVLAWATEKVAWVSRQRSLMKADVDSEADDAIRRIQEIERSFRDVYGDGLKTWVRDNAPRKKKSVRLMAIDIGLRAQPSSPKRIENPNEEAALIAWVEEHLGFDYIERKPRVRWKEVKDKLIALGVERGPQGRAVVTVDPQDGKSPLCDIVTGELTPLLVPGVEVSEAGEILWAKSNVDDKNEGDEE